MSKTTLESPTSSDVLYEEDTEATTITSDPVTTTQIQTDETDKDKTEDEGEGEGESSNANPKTAGNTKSKNTILIEAFITHYLRHGTPHCEYKKWQPEPQNLDTNTLSCSAVVLDYETDRVDPLYEDLEALLSDILSIKVRYKIISNETEEEKFGFFIVKVPPQNPEDRQLSTLAQADHREILFYTKTVPDIKNFIERKGIDVFPSIPQCFHANYDRTMEESPVQGIVEDLTRAESILILEDLRPQGFGKRHYVQPLSLAEVRVALKEIARIHAITWVMGITGEGGGQSLKKSWNFYYKPEYSAMLYEALLEDGLPRFEKFLREMVASSRDLNAAKILERLTAFRSRGLRSVLYRLLTQSKSPAPTCLVHMDFWCDNIFFRHSDSENETFSSGGDGSNYLSRLVDGEKIADSDVDVPLDCQITDWQMFSIGRPTHDVALLLFTGLDAKVRKEVTDSMLEYYYKVFQNTAGKFNLSLPFTLLHIHEEYRRSQLWAVLQVIASIDLVLNDDTTKDRLIDATLDLIHQSLF